MCTCARVATGKVRLLAATGAPADSAEERCLALAVRLLGDALGAWSGGGAAAGASDEAPLLRSGAAGARAPGLGERPCGTAPRAGAQAPPRPEEAEEARGAGDARPETPAHAAASGGVCAGEERAHVRAAEAAAPGAAAAAAAPGEVAAMWAEALGDMLQPVRPRRESGSAGPTQCSCGASCLAGRMKKVSGACDVTSTEAPYRTPCVVQG